MHKKFATLVSRICHSPGMPVCSEEDPMPEVDFNYCDPTVKLSEIKRVFFGLVSSDAFDDWFNPDSWNARLSFTSTDRNAIRAITCIADKPQPTSIKKQLSNDRRKITSKTHVINVTVDESTPTNHTFFQSLKKGRKLRVWYETMGGLMFGSNNGIMATVFADMVLNRGVGEIQVYNMEIIWETLELEQYIGSPIFEEGGVEAPELETTMMLYPFMNCAANGDIHPSISGYWDFGFTEGASFEHLVALTNAYPMPDHTFKYILEEDWFASASTSDIDSTPALVPQPLLDLDYQVPFSLTSYDMLLFSAVSDQTIRFEDILGNQASFMPLIILHGNSNTVKDCAIAECLFELVYSTGLLSTVRLTRSHAATTSARITSKTMLWNVPVGFSPRPDPADPLNNDVILVDLPAGNHTLGVTTVYSSSFWSGNFPASKLSFVVRVV